MSWFLVRGQGEGRNKGIHKEAVHSVAAPAPKYFFVENEVQEIFRGGGQRWKMRAAKFAPFELKMPLRPYKKKKYVSDTRTHCYVNSISRVGLRAGP